MRYALRIAHCVVILLLAITTAPIFSADFFTPEKTVNLDVWGEGANVALSQIAAQVGKTPIVSVGVSGGKLEHVKVYLYGKNLTLRQTIEWLARALGCRYRVINAEKLVMTPGYDWQTAKNYGVILRNVETLIGIEHAIDRRERLMHFEKMVNELMKIVSLFEPEFRVRLEEHTAEQIKLNAQVPAELKPLFMHALAALENVGASFSTPQPLLIAPAERQLIEKLSKVQVVVAYRNRPLKEVIVDLAAQSGLNIGFEQPRNWTPPLITLELGNVNIQTALIELAKKIGLRNVEMSPPAGVWLSRQPKAWTSMPSREVLWSDNVELKCYSLNALNGKIDGEHLAAWLRQNVFPAVWNDPLASIIYHPLSNNLLIIAPPSVQAAVYNALCLTATNLTEK